MYRLVDGAHYHHLLHISGPRVRWNLAERTVWRERKFEASCSLLGNDFLFANGLNVKYKDIERATTINGTMFRHFIAVTSVILSSAQEGVKWETYGENR